MVMWCDVMSGEVRWCDVMWWCWNGLGIISGEKIHCWDWHFVQGNRLGISWGKEDIVELTYYEAPDLGPTISLAIRVVFQSIMAVITEPAAQRQFQATLPNKCREILSSSLQQSVWSWVRYKICSERLCLRVGFCTCLGWSSLCVCCFWNCLHRFLMIKQCFVSATPLHIPKWWCWQDQQNNAIDRSEVDGIWKC